MIPAYQGLIESIRIATGIRRHAQSIMDGSIRDVGLLQALIKAIETEISEMPSPLPSEEEIVSKLGLQDGYAGGIRFDGGVFLCWKAAAWEFVFRSHNEMRILEGQLPVEHWTKRTWKDYASRLLPAPSNADIEELIRGVRYELLLVQPTRTEPSAFERFRNRSADELMSREDVANLCGVTTQAVDKWANKDPRFPKAVSKAGKHMYRCDDIESFLKVAEKLNLH